MSAPGAVAAREAERAAAVADAMDDIAKIDAHGREHGGIDRAGIAHIKERLLELAEHENLFPIEDFPPPDGERGSCNYRIAQNDDGTLALYVQSVGAGTSAPPHEHTTWAVIVGMRGQELNRFYDCCADEGEPHVEREEWSSAVPESRCSVTTCTRSTSRAHRPTSTAMGWQWSR